MANGAPLTIVHCLAPAPIGGLESVVRTLAIGQQRRGHRVVIAAVVDCSGHPFLESVQGNGLEVVPLDIPPRDYRRERRLVGDLLRAVEPDVLHTHGYRPDIADLAVGRRQGIGTITTLHGFIRGDWKIWLYEQLQMRAIRQADAVVAVSEGGQERALRGGVRPDAVHLIRNAYASTTPVLLRNDARRLIQVDAEGFRIGWIGRLSAEKGPDVMLEALSQLRDAPVTLSYIGDGPDRVSLAEQAETFHVTRQTTFHGIVPNAAQLLPAFDAFVLSSRTEGTPMVVLEAMAAGTPIIATRVGGIPAMLSEAEAALVPPDNPTALAAAIREVLTNPALAAARAARGRIRLDAEFGAEPWLSRYESLYRALQRTRIPRTPVLRR